MINHGRTLLLNLDGPRDPQPALPGDVYIPPYTAVEPSTQVEALRSTLYGSTPDYRGQLYRTAQYLSVIHATPYESYLLDLDSRVTYAPAEWDLTEGYGAWIDSTSGSEASVIGLHTPDAFEGRVEERWTITALSALQVSAVRTSNQQESVQTVSFGKALSTPIVLPGSDTLTARITEPSELLTPGDRWFVHSLARPRPELPAILAALRGFGSSDIFRQQTIEPWKTFWSLYSGHPSTTYQLAGFLLGLIYHTEEVRTFGG